MNLSHIIHEFSFGPFFPAIAQPLDMTYVKTEESEFRVRVLSIYVTSHLVMQSEFQCFSIQFKLEIEIANFDIDDDDDMTLIRCARIPDLSILFERGPDDVYRFESTEDPD
jgi:hypothetical protein